MSLLAESSSQRCYIVRMEVKGSLAIELTKHEQSLLSIIDSNGVPYQRFADAMEELAQSLLKRNAVPQCRIQYVEEPEHFIGGHGRSRLQNIEANGSGTPVMRSPHFEKVLRYFIFGPSLPKQVILKFEQAVQECGVPFTGSDALVVATRARMLAREHGIAANNAPDEFYKLGIECGLGANEARVVRDKVKAALR